MGYIGLLKRLINSSIFLLLCIGCTTVHPIQVTYKDNTQEIIYYKGRKDIKLKLLKVCDHKKDSSIWTSPRQFNTDCRYNLVVISQGVPGKRIDHIATNVKEFK